MLFSLLALPALSLAAVISQRAAVCSDPPVRKEWRKLSTDERAGYVKAVQCLATKPSRINLTTTLYDDFAYVHDKLNNEIHFVASFLPWHRYFVQVYEDALHDCGYNGSATYWDWSLDSSDPASSAIWDAKTGIGGNGNQSHTEYVFGSNMRCVTDGPFSSLRPAYLGTRWAQHCLARNFNNGTYSVGDMLGYAYTPAEVKRIGEMPDYNRFRNSLEGGPHGAVHSAIGGDMSPSTSPNDPVFFLHHTQIDRLWYLWQQEDPEARYTDYSGIKTQDQFDGTIPPPSSIDDVLPMLGLADDLTVKDVMSTTVGPFCYSY